jgi:protein-tyrosine phosphatase
MRHLQTNTPGSLYLHSMPGRYEPMAEFISDLQYLNIARIICLTAADEILCKSPVYLDAIKSGKFATEHIVFPIPDFGVPDDVEAFYSLARDVLELLRNGQNNLVHCAGGIGRTGMFAGCVLNILGQPLEALRDSGSYPETAAQREVVHLAQLHSG